MTGSDTFPGKVIGRAEESEGEPAPTVDAPIVTEPDEDTAFAMPPEAQSTMPLPSDPPTIFLGGLFILAALAALYAASEIILPIVLAFVLKLLLQPAMRLLERLHVPRVVGALLTILLVVGSLVGLGAALLGPAETWAAKLPEGIPRLAEHLKVLRTPIDALQRILHQAEQVATGPVGSNTTIAVQGGISNALLGGTRALVSGVFTTVLVLFFLLVSGDTFLRRFVEILPRFQDKRQAVDISQQIEHDISRYLVTITTMNAAVGAATAAAMYVCGLGDPILWGAVAFLLNYVPILGPLTGVGIFFLAGLLSFDSVWSALLPVASYFVIHLIEGETVTPMLHARRFTLNPVLVVLSLIFWFWMWGVPGAILSVPMLAITKIICDRIRPLMALGHFLEG
jgi:predicted PurR-regulated permease PerM